MKHTIDQTFIRSKDITLIVTVIGLLAALWKYSGLDEIKKEIKDHGVQIAVIQSQYNDIKSDLEEIKSTSRQIKRNTQ
jgi:hypothetical protein